MMSSENSTSYPDDSELELGLGLSIGGGGGGGWYRRGRILTAENFAASSSSSSSCSPVTNNNNNNNNNNNRRTKRVGEPFSPASRSAVSQVAGWPPIGIHRMNSLINHSKSPPTEESTSTVDKCKSTNNVADNKTNYSRNLHNNAAKERGLRKSSLFVKVNMDGISIGRKVDLNAHKCYETLARTLDHMFMISGPVVTKRSGLEEQVVMGVTDRPLRLLDGSSDFVLTYEDKDGDWMLVGDVPWEMFLSSVRRLRIRRTTEAKGLVPRR